MLKIYLFGRIRLEHEHVPIHIKMSPSVQVLLAYLLLQPKRNHSRDVLMELGWGDRPQSQARSCLNTALWRLRNILEPEGVVRGAYLMTGQAGDVGFNWESDYWLDLAVFEREVSGILDGPWKALDESKAARLESITALYTGDLLEGLYQAWALREQERLRVMFLNSLGYLLYYYHQTNRFEKAIKTGNQILRHDPLREDVHRELMGIYLQTGQRALAAQQYETCRSALQNELGILPMPETSALYEQTLASSIQQLSGWRAPDAHLAALSGEDLQETINYLKSVLNDLDSTRQKVKRALLMLERSKIER